MKKKIEITIPESLNDITVEQYVKYYTLVKPKTKDILSIFFGLKHMDTFKLSIDAGEKLINSVSEVLEQEPKFLKTFMYEGVNYGFIPNLDKMTLGEKLDLEDYVNDIHDLDRFMAICYRPITIQKGDQYRIEEYEGSDKYLEVMKKAPIGVALGAKVFFCDLLKDSLNYTLDYMAEQVDQQANSSENLADIINYTNLQIDRLRKCFNNPNFQYTKQ